ncbi:MAG TPA: carboxypeptidase-like regulatory domain-containing protein [Chthoniobacterales bacterium]
MFFILLESPGSTPHYKSMKIRALLAVGSILSVSSAFAQKSAIEGTAIGSDGRPLKNAQVQVQPENAKSPAVITKTDAKGHFVASDLPVRGYKVRVLISGAVKLSADHVQTVRDQAVRVNFGGKQGSVATATAEKNKKRWVWVPSGTGTHLGGHYESVDQAGAGDAANADGQNIGRMNSHQLERMQIQTSRAPSGSP